MSDQLFHALILCSIAFALGALIYSLWSEWKLRRDLATDAQLRKGFKLLAKWGKL